MTIATPFSIAVCCLATLTTLTLAPVAAADTTLAPDAVADEVTALDGTIVWISGTFGDQVLMQRSPAGIIARVRGAPHAKAYRTIDLGHDRKNRLVLTYERCKTASSCKPFLDNLKGTRSSYKHLTIKRCEVATAPAVWRARLAYGLLCRKPNHQRDDARSGLYVRNGTQSPRRMRMPKDAKKFGVTGISSVDMRGTRVAAIASDIYEYAFTEQVDETGLRSVFSAASEGDSDEHTTGLALGAGGAMWALTDAEHAGDPNQARILRVAGTCYDLEALVNPAGPDQENGYLATDLAVDGATLYLVVPGTGIVQHPFAPQGACTPL
ncbi:MAG: hypothetical protein QOG15_1528 [Solirubrobacteraceae bacterium]|nr:hypothetical protein [Solirubrobacteraceae bacterium]